MPPVLTNGTVLQCSFGLAPSTLTVLPVARTLAVSAPAATIFDNIPMLNIAPFSMCTSIANPAVAAATAAAMGVLTPSACVPVIPAPWTPGQPTVLIGNKPALTQGSMCNCAYGGVINPVMPAQVTVIAG